MKVLLLTDMPPCNNYTAGIFLNHLVSMIPENDVVCYAVLNPTLKPEIPSGLARESIKVVKKPKEGWGKLPVVGPLVSYIMEILIELVRIPKLSHDIAKYAKRQGVEAIWCILEGQTMIRLARRTADLAKLPLYTHIWDPPGWWMRAWKVNKFTAGKVLAEYDSAIRQSLRCGVASWAMKEEYEKRYGVECIPLVAGLDKDSLLEPASQPRFFNNEIQIGLAGQIYARDTWDALVNALDAVHWMICGHPVKIKVLGQWLDPALHRPTIDFLGWHSQKETIELLSQMDILYAPYWFDPMFEEESRLSFPSKVTTYIASGRPAFFHGPAYSSPGRFLLKHNAGECCFSKSKTEIIDQITRLVSDDHYYQQITANAYDLFLKKLSFDALRENFYAFLFANRG